MSSPLSAARWRANDQRVSLLEPLIKIGLSLVLLALALEDVRHQKIGSALPWLFSGVVMWRSLTVLPALGLLWGALLVAPTRSGLRQPRWLLVGVLVIVAAGMGVNAVRGASI